MLGYGFDDDLDESEIRRGDFLESSPAEINDAAMFDEAPGWPAVGNGDHHTARFKFGSIHRDPNVCAEGIEP